MISGISKYILKRVSLKFLGYFVLVMERPVEKFYFSNENLFFLSANYIYIGGHFLETLKYQKQNSNELLSYLTLCTKNMSIIMRIELELNSFENVCDFYKWYKYNKYHIRY